MLAEGSKAKGSKDDVGLRPRLLSTDETRSRNPCFRYLPWKGIDMLFPNHHLADVIKVIQNVVQFLCFVWCGLAHCCLFIQVRNSIKVLRKYRVLRHLLRLVGQQGATQFTTQCFPRQANKEPPNSQRNVSLANKVPSQVPSQVPFTSTTHFTEKFADGPPSPARVRVTCGLKRTSPVWRRRLGLGFEEGKSGGGGWGQGGARFAARRVKGRAGRKQSAGNGVSRLPERKRADASM